MLFLGVFVSTFLDEISVFIHGPDLQMADRGTAEPLQLHEPIFINKYFSVCVCTHACLPVSHPLVCFSGEPRLIQTLFPNEATFTGAGGWWLGFAGGGAGGCYSTPYRHVTWSLFFIDFKEKGRGERERESH